MSTKRRLVCALLLICLSVGHAHGQGGPTVEVFNDSRSEQAGAGSPLLQRLPVRVAVTTNAGFDTSVSTGAFSESRSSSFAQSGISLNYAFGTSRTRANLTANTSIIYYPELDSFQPDVDLRLAVKHQASRRLSLSAQILTRYGSQPIFRLSGNPDLDTNDSNQRGGNFLDSRSSLSASYQWLPRFSTVNSYSLRLRRYDEEAVAASRNRVEHRFGQQLRYLLLPVTTIVGEYRLALASYEDSSRDSTTNVLLGGIEQTFSSRLTGSFRAGVQFRSADGDGSDQTRPYFSSNVNYVLGENTEINWTSRYSIQESDSSDVTGPTSRTSFRTGLGLRHAITPRISASLSAYYSSNAGGSNTPNGNGSSSRDLLVFSLSASYAVNRHLSANVGYTHIEGASDGVASSRNRYTAGVNFAF
ncbi:MAG: hypothetical protein H0W28_11735 [Pyrinomonadaceae bacterium]|nr:hypothetical protein [Pyrinomonadaceae bacterium]